MQITEFQRWVEKTDNDTQWNLLTTLQILSHLTEEVGEVAQSINRIYGYEEEREEHLANLGRELMGVLAPLQDRKSVQRGPRRRSAALCRAHEFVVA